MNGLFDLTGFQRDMLYVLSSEGGLNGRAIQEELEKEIGEISRGRLYPNLDTLVTNGYVKKGQVDLRTNSYTITEYGLEQLKERRRWENKHVDFADL